MVLAVATTTTYGIDERVGKVGEAGAGNVPGCPPEPAGMLAGC